MSNIAIKVEDVSKQYRLGKIGTGTFSHDLNRWWHTVRGKEDPYLKIGDLNDRSRKGVSEYVWALKNISFDIKRGDVVGIIGKNGAGKSTLLKLLSRTTLPTTGNIKIRGRVASLLEVGTGFHPELSGRENIFLNGAILGMTKTEIKSKFEEIVDFSGVERYIDTPVKRYSSGMYVRLAFAVAAHLEPEILIVDEVLAVGDAEFQRRAIGKMRDVSRSEGRTVLVVSHNMASVKSLCTSGIILKNGNVFYTGTADDAVSEYLKGQNGNGTISLEDRQDRSGNGKFRFVDFVIKDSKNQVVSDVISNEPATFEIHYRTTGYIDEKKLILGLNIQDENRQNVLTFVSDEMNVNLKPLERSGVIKISLDHLSLRGEGYSIRLLAFEGSTAVENTLDIVEDAALLSVLPGDINGIGKINRKGFGAVTKGVFIN